MWANSISKTKNLFEVLRKTLQYSQIHIAGVIHLETLIPDLGQELFDLRLDPGGYRQERGAGFASKISIEVASVLDSCDSQFAADSIACREQYAAAGRPPS